MELKAIIMGIVGFLLLYGGLAACIGIAWYHGKRKKEEQATTDI
jgi:hypothetical protein